MIHTHKEPRIAPGLGVWKPTHKRQEQTDYSSKISRLVVTLSWRHVFVLSQRLMSIKSTIPFDEREQRSVPVSRFLLGPVDSFKLGRSPFLQAKSPDRETGHAYSLLRPNCTRHSGYRLYPRETYSINGLSLGFPALPGRVRRPCRSTGLYRDWAIVPRNSGHQLHVGATSALPSRPLDRESCVP